MTNRKRYKLPEEVEALLLAYCEKTGKDPEQMVGEGMRLVLGPLLKFVADPSVAEERGLRRLEPLKKKSSRLPMSRVRSRAAAKPKRKAKKGATVKAAKAVKRAKKVPARAASGSRTKKPR